MTSPTSTPAAPPSSWSLGGMLFDAWLTLGHHTSLTITQHPVELGANITDHAFINPKRFSFGVGYSDVLGGSLTGAISRSVNAYNQLVALQESRAPLRLVSKYGTYDNILIESIEVPDNFQTNKAMRATVNLVQIIMVSTSPQPVSNNPQVTDKTNKGVVAGQAIRPDYAQAALNWLGNTAEFLGKLFPSSFLGG